MIKTLIFAILTEENDKFEAFDGIVALWRTRRLYSVFSLKVETRGYLKAAATPLLLFLSRNPTKRTNNRLSTRSAPFFLSLS